MSCFGRSFLFLVTVLAVVPGRSVAFRFPAGDPANGSPYVISQQFQDTRYNNTGYKGHLGEDWAMKVGTPIFAIAPGTVVEARDYFGNWGNVIIIDHGVLPSGRRIYGMYAHLSKLLVKKGQPLTTNNNPIGLSGEKGSGPHLHFEIKDYQGTAVGPGKAYTSSNSQVGVNTIVFEGVKYYRPSNFLLVNPRVGATPSSGPQGTSFDESGTGFTRNSTATLYFRRAGQQPVTLVKSTNSSGTYSHVYQSTTADIPAVYDYWAIDDTTGIQSSTVNFEITAANLNCSNNPQCQSGSCCTISCQYSANGQVCRPSVASCDPVETCTGTTGDCPSDVFTCDARYDFVASRAELRAGTCDSQNPPSNTVVTNPVAGQAVCPVGVMQITGSGSVSSPGIPMRMLVDNGAGASCNPQTSLPNPAVSSTIIYYCPQVQSFGSGSHQLRFEVNQNQPRQAEIDYNNDTAIWNFTVP